MNLLFANPWGFLALLGLPAVLLLHFLQRESRRVKVSSLFLLEQLAPESARGRRWDRLRNSATLWWQLLAVLLLAWLLAAPRWIRSDSVQQVVLVLDGSASMSAFAAEIRKNLPQRLETISRAAARTDWTILESQAQRQVLYAGSDREAALAALEKWQPNGPHHDPEPALRTALGLVRGQGAVIFLTDHEWAVPPGVSVLAMGAPMENVGFTGWQAGPDDWRVLVRNHHGQAVRRGWNIDERAQGVLDLAPGAITELRGVFPPGVDRLTLSMDADGFTLDDSLPMVRPQPKRLGLQTEPGTPFDAFFAKFTATVPDRNPDGRDVILTRYDPLLPRLPESDAVVVVDHPGKPGNLVQGPIVAASHPLVEGLSWQQLLVQETLSVVPRETDDWLVTQGERPLVLLRHTGKGRLLVLNFDLRHSNAARLPAVILTLRRFVESVREGVPGVEVVNVETGQMLKDGQRAPVVPGFFAHPTVRGAAGFADGREADFSRAMKRDDVAGLVSALRLQNSEQDFLFPIWTVLLLIVCGASWLSIGGVRAGFPGKNGGTP